MDCISSFTTLKKMITLLTKKTNTQHYIKSVRIRHCSSPHFSRIFSHSDWIRRATPYLFVFSPNTGKCGKGVDQNNSEYGHFLCSAASKWMRCQSFEWMNGVPIFLSTIDKSSCKVYKKQVLTVTQKISCCEDFHENLHG